MSGTNIAKNGIVEGHGLTIALHIVVDELGQTAVAKALNLDRKTVHRRLHGKAGVFTWSDMAAIARLEQERLLTDRLRCELIAALMVDEEEGHPTAVVNDTSEAMAATVEKITTLHRVATSAPSIELYADFRASCRKEISANRRLDRDLASACGCRPWYRHVMAGAACFIMTLGLIEAALGDMSHILRVRRSRRRDEQGEVLQVVPA